MPNFEKINQHETPEAENSANPIEPIGPIEPLEPIDHEAQDCKIGAKLLSSVSFEKRHQDIVDSSFHKAEKLPVGSGAERRNYAYVSRIEDLVSKYGNRVEKRLWDRSSTQLVINLEDVPDSYWRAQEQLIYDRVGEKVKLSAREKFLHTQELQEQQRESLKLWSDYLGNENSPYPMWFKVYAWDGMSKMSGVFDPEKKQFRKRNPHTVSPYPKLNPAALAKVYDEITEFYNISDANRPRSHRERAQDDGLRSLVQSGNFPKLYAKMLLETKTTVKTPENPQDVSGKWIEYLPGQEDELAKAAEGTPWCIASPNIGKNYLTYGSYSAKEQADDAEDSKAKFILFHLHDPITHELSSSACASIRLGTDGQVAEISGLADGSSQRVEDSLLPTVEEKVRTLPGGENYLEAFANLKYLTALTHKFEDGEPFDANDLDFIFKGNDGYRQLNGIGSDFRLSHLKYSITEMLENGTDADLLASYDEPRHVLECFDAYTEHGAHLDVNDLLSELRYADDVLLNLDTLMENGANIDLNSFVRRLNPKSLHQIRQDILEGLLKYGTDANLLASKLNSYDQMRNIDLFAKYGVNFDANELVSKIDMLGFDEDEVNNLLQHGANIGTIAAAVNPRHYIRDLKSFDKFNQLGANLDLNAIVSQANPEDIVSHLDELKERGVQIGIDELVAQLKPEDILGHQKKLEENGAHIDIDEIASKLSSFRIECNIDTLVKQGVDVNVLASRMNPKDTAEILEKLIEYGADLDFDYLASQLDYSKIANDLDIFLEHCTNFDLDSFVEESDSEDLSYNLETLVRHGVDAEKLYSRLEPWDIAENLDFFVENGVAIDIDSLVPQLDSSDIADNLSALVKHGADIDDLVTKMEDEDISSNLEEIIQNGANIDQLVACMEPEDIIENLDLLLENKAIINIDSLIAEIHPIDLVLNSKTLMKHGVNIDVNALMSEINPSTIAHYLDKLIWGGVPVNVDELAQKLDEPAKRRYSRILTRHGAHLD